MNTYKITYRFMNAGLSEVTKEASTPHKAKRKLFDQLGSRYLTIISIEKVG